MTLIGGDAALRGVILLELVICSCPRNCNDKVVKHLADWTDVLLSLTMVCSSCKIPIFIDFLFFFSSFSFPLFSLFLYILRSHFCPTSYLSFYHCCSTFLLSHLSSWWVCGSSMTSSISREWEAWDRRSPTCLLSSWVLSLNSHFLNNFHKALLTFDPKWSSQHF